MVLRDYGDQTTQVIQVEPLDIWVKSYRNHCHNIFKAPEVMCRQNHGVAVDYYALGVIAYECMMGKV